MQKRKPTRLKGYDYSQNGAYFITICTHNKKHLLSTIVGDDAHIVPQNKLSKIGLICDKYINNINIKYGEITVDKYVIMPNHIHLIISINGTMRASSPTIFGLMPIVGCGDLDAPLNHQKKNGVPGSSRPTMVQSRRGRPGVRSLH